MTAIAVIPTPDGIVLAADGRSRWGDESTRDEAARQGETDSQQKIFKAEWGKHDVAWAVTGSVFNRDRSFSLIREAKRSFSEAAKAQDYVRWISSFAEALRVRVQNARDSGIAEPFTENELHPSGSPERLTIARIVVAGYLWQEQPSVTIVRLFHASGALENPSVSTSSPPDHDFFVGSEEIGKRYCGSEADERFLKYMRPRGNTLAQALQYAKGYIDACCDPCAEEVDPVCKGIGGHIHAAAATRSGFTWLIRPI